MIFCLFAKYFFSRSSFLPTKGAESREAGFQLERLVRAACGENQSESGDQLGIRAAAVYVLIFRFTKICPSADDAPRECRRRRREHPVSPARRSRVMVKTEVRVSPFIPFPKFIIANRFQLLKATLFIKFIRS